ncbi:hypothetical protein [uncultured Bilophila sp.]|uniref:hypothetical protein n=1 Tax=uncultured Bilophila sp. TaxID=529385 RepID=UPI0026DCDCEC|nr:hypothetical protein [uncultured Bilophila sp.]
MFDLFCGFHAYSLCLVLPLFVVPKKAQFMPLIFRIPLPSFVFRTFSTFFLLFGEGLAARTESADGLCAKEVEVLFCIIPFTKKEYFDGKMHLRTGFILRNVPDRCFYASSSNMREKRLPCDEKNKPAGIKKDRKPRGWNRR